ncbi:MAG: glycosyltransferase family 2 protein [Lachnospiraceae bacterium]|nr:glycosyltransferase family 2 protein [Lachnospiraceae bacterium]
MGKEDVKVSVVMPCLNEECAVGACVDEAYGYLERNGICGEVIVVDNGSTDNSALIAKCHRAKVISQKKKGYGCALRSGFNSARGDIIIMADCDTTYDLSEMGSMISLIDEGYDLVIGDRITGGRRRCAMSVIHRIGAMMLSKIGRQKIHTDVNDFHCGIRGIRREALGRLKFHTEGMEFATEMIAEAVKEGLRITQIPVTLRKCTVMRRSKLSIVRDGYRHLKYMITLDQ